jgi:hypothetical protein
MTIYLNSSLFIRFSDQNFVFIYLVSRAFYILRPSNHPWFFTLIILGEDSKLCCSSLSGFLQLHSTSSPGFKYCLQHAVLKYPLFLFSFSRLLLYVCVHGKLLSLQNVFPNRVNICCDYRFCDRLCGLVVRVSGYRSRSPGFDSPGL